MNMRTEDPKLKKKRGFMYQSQGGRKEIGGKHCKEVVLVGCAHYGQLQNHR